MPQIDMHLLLPTCRLPEGFTQLLNLTELYLNDTFLDYLPGSFGRYVQHYIFNTQVYGWGTQKYAYTISWQGVIETCTYHQQVEYHRNMHPSSVDRAYGNMHLPSVGKVAQKHAPIISRQDIIESWKHVPTISRQNIIETCTYHQQVEYHRNMHLPSVGRISQKHAPTISRQDIIETCTYHQQVGYHRNMHLL